MSKPKILNFKWWLETKIATGSKPSYASQLAWLKQQGFKAILSLEAIPDDRVEEIQQSDIRYLLLEIEDYEEGDFSAYDVTPEIWQSFCDFINLCLEKKEPLFIHCSGGIARSPRMVRRYLTQHRPG